MDNEEKHLEIITQLQDLNTKFDKVVEPAVKQVYDNEKDIIKIKSFLTIVKYVGTSVSGIFMFITIRSIWTWIKPH